MGLDDAAREDSLELLNARLLVEELYQLQELVGRQPASVIIGSRTSKEAGHHKRERAVRICRNFS